MGLLGRTGDADCTTRHSCSMVLVSLCSLRYQHPRAHATKSSPRGERRPGKRGRREGGRMLARTGKHDSARYQSADRYWSTGFLRSGPMIPAPPRPSNQGESPEEAPSCSSSGLVLAAPKPSSSSECSSGAVGWGRVFREVGNVGATTAGPSRSRTLILSTDVVLATPAGRVVQGNRPQGRSLCTRQRTGWHAPSFAGSWRTPHSRGPALR